MLDRLCIVGVNYDKANVEVRGAFSVNEAAYGQIAGAARRQDIKSLFILSTCNRTEICGFVASPAVLAELLVTYTRGTKKQLLDCGYQKYGVDALIHLFKVSAGLDSQILGDYEILGQLKRTAQIAKSHQMIGPLMDRVLNFAFQSSKRIKTETMLSHGTVSVSFAAINVLQDIPDLTKKKVVLMGTGKFGTNVSYNLNKYFRDIQLTILNRTDATAMQLAHCLNATHCSFSNRCDVIRNADIVIVCTNAQEHTITSDMVSAEKPQLYLDLSVPVNVDPQIRKKTNVRLVDVDEISSSILDKTLAARKAEIPRAIGIINECISELLVWVSTYRYSFHLKTWKKKLIELPAKIGDVCMPADCEIDDQHKAQQAKKTLKQLAINLKEQNDKGCQFIKSVNDYLDNHHAKN